MKQVFTLIIALGFALGLSNTLQAQQYEAVVEIDKKESIRNRNILVPVFAEFDKGKVARSFELTIRYNTNVLEFLDIPFGNIDPLFLALDEVEDPESPTGVTPPVQANLKILWEYDDDIPNATEDFNGPMFYLEFYYKGGTSNIELKRKNLIGVTEVGGGDPVDTTQPREDWEPKADFILTEFIDGRVSEIFVPVPLSNWPIYLGLVMVISFLAVRIGRIF